MLQAVVTSVEKSRLEAFFGRDAAECILRHIERGDNLEDIFGSAARVIQDIMGHRTADGRLKRSSLGLF
jgi:hypothetical protein